MSRKTCSCLSARSADGLEKTHQVSARSEANRMLEVMPAKGREFYELVSGPRPALLDAKKDGGTRA